MNIDEINQFLTDGKIKWSAHGLMRIQERDLTVDDLKIAISTGEIIENYPEESPAKSSVLIYGKNKDGKVIHIVIGYDEEQLYFVTAYYPSIEKFENDLKTRRK